MIESGIKPPKARSWEPRLTDEMKAVQAGHSFVCNARTAACFKAYGVAHLWTTRQEKIGEDQIRVWRIS